MRHKKYCLPFLLVLLVLFTSCASSYNMKAHAAQEALHRGDFDQAAELIEKVEYANRDKLLSFLDRGMILHAAGRYQESNAALTQAEEISDEFSAKSVSREAAAALWSEEATWYGGEKFERTLIPVVRMLNYIMLDDWEGALVEVRHIGTVAEKAYGSQREFKNAFALYLSGVVWEALGKINDALIDYQRIAGSNADLPYVSEDIREMSRKLGLAAEPTKKGRSSRESSANYRKQKGELVVVVEAGRAPYFVAEYISIGAFTVSVPVVMGSLSPPEDSKIMIDGHEAGYAHAFYNVGEDILKALSERAKRSFIRKMVKLSVQTGLYTAGTELSKKKETEDQLAGIALVLLGASMAAAEKADERSWRTLPAVFEIGRFYLPTGLHEVEILPPGGGAPVKKSVEVTAAKPEVVLARFGESGGAFFARALAAKIVTATARAGSEPSAEARAHFDSGLEEEKNGHYDKAALEFAAAYKGGMVEDQVAKKFIECYGKTDEKFRKSEEGSRALSDFTDSYLTVTK